MNGKEQLKSFKQDKNPDKEIRKELEAQGW